MVKKVFIRRRLPEHSAPVKRMEQSENDVLEENEEELPEGGNKLVVVIFVVLVLFGVGTGFILSRKLNASTTGDGVSVSVQDGKKSVGMSDTTTFKDSAIGTLEEGGLNGEGTHNLIREGGPSQTVYLISSVVDLDQFVGKKVTVWGQTMAAKKVPWLMDVGRVDLE